MLSTRVSNPTISVCPKTRKQLPLTSEISSLLQSVASTTRLRRLWRQQLKAYSQPITDSRFETTLEVSDTAVCLREIETTLAYAAAPFS